MQELIILLEAWIRLAFFVLFALIFFWMEEKYSYRLIRQRKERFTNHLIIVAVSTLLIRLIFPIMLVDLAIKVRAEDNWSLLLMPELINLPFWVHVILGFIGMDFIMYWQHRILHRVNFLWRLHLMHHTDQQLDITTGVRFHPLEYLFSMGFKMLGIILIGPPVLAVIIFEVVLNAASLFTHANIQLPRLWDFRLRKLIVTPGMHRVHHSDIRFERDHNFGFFLSCWDRMLGTYLPFSCMSERKLVLGVESCREAKHQTIKGMLLAPFFRKQKQKKRKGPGKYRKIPG